MPAGRADIVQSQNFVINLQRREKEEEEEVLLRMEVVHKPPSADGPSGRTRTDGRD